jgi:hypothetical protein
MSYREWANTGSLPPPTRGERMLRFISGLMIGVAIGMYVVLQHSAEIRQIGIWLAGSALGSLL